MSERIGFDTGLRMIIEAAFSGIHTAFPAKVESFDPVLLRCELQPCLQRRYPNAEPSNLPKITDVPVLYPSSGNLTIVFPLDVGSYVLCICSERSLEQWLTAGDVVDPADSRMHDLSDAIAVPGLFPLPNVLVPPPVAGTLEIRNAAGTSILCVTDTEIQLQCGNVIPPVDYAVKYDQLKIAFDQLKSDFNTHTHSYNPGPSPAAQTVTPTVPSAADMSLAKVANVRLP